MDGNACINVWLNKELWINLNIQLNYVGNILYKMVYYVNDEHGLSGLLFVESHSIRPIILTLRRRALVLLS